NQRAASRRFMTRATPAAFRPKLNAPLSRGQASTHCCAPGIRTASSVSLVPATLVKRNTALMTIDEKLVILHDSIKGLEHIAAMHQQTIEAHDRQIEALLALAEKQAVETVAMKQAMLDLQAQWQAYLRRIPPQ